MCFLADHGNIAWPAGLTVIANEQNGQGEPLKVVHLLGKDSYDVLCNTAQPILNEDLSYHQDSALLIIRNNAGAENDEDIQQECLLVPRKAFINSYAAPFEKFFLTEPVDQGDQHQKVLIDSLEWKSIEQVGRLLYDPTTKEISGVSWQNIDREEVKKEFRDGPLVRLTVSSTGYPGNVSYCCAWMREGTLNGCHVPLEKRIWQAPIATTATGQNKTFTLDAENSGQLHPWQQWLGPSETKSYQLLQVEKLSPLGYNGVKYPSMFWIPVHLRVPPTHTRAKPTCCSE
jgi:hypothetical protein